MKELKTKPLEWYTEQRVINDLIPYEFNPRKLTREKKQKLKDSLEKFNLAEIPVINTDNVVVAGHQRIKVLLELGRGSEVIDVRVPSRPLNEDELKEYNVRSNVGYGEWHLELLTEHFESLDFEEVGFDPKDLKIPSFEFLNDYSDESEGDPILEIPKETIFKDGDLIELQSISKNIKHVVFCGDSTKKESYSKILQGEKTDLNLTDPPYNVNYEGKTKDKLTIQNDNMETEAFNSFLEGFYSALFEFTNEGAGIYIFHADSEWNAFRTNFVQSGFYLSQSLVWLKDNFVLGRQDYHWKHEPILYGWKPGKAHNWHGDRKQSTVIQFEKPKQNTEHPTMKPVDMLIYLIKNSTKQEHIVCDSFLGSGSTLIACEQSWRQCRGIELDPRFIDVIVNRWLMYMKGNNLEYRILVNGEVYEPELITHE